MHLQFRKEPKMEKVFSKKMIFTKNLLFGRSTDWLLRNPPPLDISFPPLSLNMNSLKQILEDVKRLKEGVKKGRIAYSIGKFLTLMSLLRKG